MEKLQQYFDVLMQEREVLISELDWTAEFEQAFYQQLNDHYQKIEIYKAVDYPHHKLICLKDHPPKIKVESQYSKRPFFKVILPMFVLAMLYFLIVSFLARYTGKMMSMSFLVLLPLTIGAISEYILSFNQNASDGQILKRQSLIVLVLLILGGIVLKEGVICLIMAAPIFLVLALLGAFLMRSLCRKIWKPYKRIYSIGLLPLLGLLFAPNISQYHQGYTTKSLVINASREHVFAAINHIQNIQPNEIKHSPIFIMGFPKPQSGMTVRTDHGSVRQIHWERGIYFEEKIIQSKAPEKLMWTYRFTPTSFPKGSLDDHIEIGGAYFNLLTTDYRLEAMNPNQTKLILRIDYRLSTELNFYSDLWVQYVLKEFSDVVLHIYKHRLEGKT